MPLRDDLQALLALQNVDGAILRARAALAGLDNGATTADAYNAAKTEADRLRALATHAQAEQKDAELRLSSVETKTAQVRKTLFSGTVTTPKELENLQKEIDMLGRQSGDGETRVLEAMETAGEQTAAAEAAEARLAALAERYRTTRAAYKKQHTELSAEIASQEKARADAAKIVPAALLTRYDALRAKKNGVGTAPLQDDESCGACHMRLNTELTVAVRAAAAPQVCEYCGRLLVPPAATA